MNYKKLCLLILIIAQTAPAQADFWHDVTSWLSSADNRKKAAVFSLALAGITFMLYKNFKARKETVVFKARNQDGAPRGKRRKRHRSVEASQSAYPAEDQEPNFPRSRKNQRKHSPSPVDPAIDQGAGIGLRWDLKDRE